MTMDAKYGCVVHGLAHPCEECAAELTAEQPEYPWGNRRVGLREWLFGPRRTPTHSIIEEADAAIAAQHPPEPHYITPKQAELLEAPPDCGACPGDGTICATSCRLMEDSPHPEGCTYPRCVTHRSCGKRCAARGSAGNAGVPLLDGKTISPSPTDGAGV